LPFCCLRPGVSGNSIEVSELHQQLAAMTKAQLLAFAEDNGITGLSNSMLKADIIAAIEEALA